VRINLKKKKDNGENFNMESFTNVLFSTQQMIKKQDHIGEGQSHLGDLGTGCRKILKKQEVTVWIRHSSFRTRSSGRLL